MKVVFFGAGNMAEALSSSILKAYPGVKIFYYSPTISNAKKLASMFQCEFVESLDLIPKDIDWYFLAFKPQNLKDFHFSFTPHDKVVSVLAGISIDKLVAKFGIDKIVRLMPNTPIKVQEGISLIYSRENVFSLSDEIELTKVLELCGKVYKMKSESELDGLTAFSGSGPALIFEFARILENELKKYISNPSISREFINQLFLGSSCLITQSSEELVTLREQVTSKKGVTYSALEIFKEKKIDSIVSEAIRCAQERTLQLSKEN